MKKLILLTAILILALAVAACSNGNNGSEANIPTGRYVEVDITPPISGQFISLLTHDGNLVVFNEGLRTRFDSTDGENWDPSPGPGSGNPRIANVTSASFLPDGNLLGFVPGEGLMIIDDFGHTTHFPVEEIDTAIAEDQNISVHQVQVLDGNRLMLTYNISDFPFGGMFNMEDLGDIDVENVVTQRRAAGGGGMGQMGGEGVRVRGAAGPGGQGTFEFMGMGNNTSSIHDLSTGQLIEEVQAPMAVSVTLGGDFHVFRDQSILLHSANGDVDTLLYGAAFAFGVQGANVSSVHSLSDGSLIVQVADRLYKYFWDENATINPDKVITVWSLEYNRAVRAAISELWRQHPDAQITYEVALAEGSAISASDAVRTLNTRLLSGDGPDVLILDGTPIDNYAARGMLLDLSDKINTAEIYHNLLAQYTSPSGQLYVVPTQFSVPALMGNAAALGQVQTLDALVDRIISGNPSAAITGRGRGMMGGIPAEERAEVHFNDLAELFDIMWQANATAFIHDNQLDSGALREFLAAMEAISNMYNLTESAPAGGGMMMMATASGAGGGMGAAQAFPGSLMQYMMQTTNFAALSINNLMMLHFTLEREDGLDLATFPGLTPGVWVPSTIASVAADTNFPDFALEFVNTLLSVQVQGINHGEGLPITRTGMAAQIDTLNETLAQMDRTFTIDIEGLIGQLHTPTILESVLQEMIFSSVESLCTGRIDLEGAVREIEQNIRNYLAERS